MELFLFLEAFYRDLNITTKWITENIGFCGTKDDDQLIEHYNFCKITWKSLLRLYLSPCTKNYFITTIYYLWDIKWCFPFFCINNEVEVCRKNSSLYIAVRMGQLTVVLPSWRYMCIRKLVTVMLSYIVQLFNIFKTNFFKSAPERRGDLG